jgi:hypothetical protein
MHRGSPRRDERSSRNPRMMLLSAISNTLRARDSVSMTSIHRLIPEHSLLMPEGRDLQFQG